MNKKYLPSALILYLNYFIHGVGCSILGQAVIKDALATAWGVEAMAITADQYRMLMQGLEIVARHPISELKETPRIM